ncbi:hypothetical protein BYT27DRAFT_6936228 [Phlegmacium glaucopus]|nr:hypothetical protein BYT27DRAFT_6936228 [Phlegmacium glaucopus]
MTYEPLTDNQLFSLCREQGDKHGSLKLFVEASTLAYASEYERPKRTPLPKIVISILDWDSQQPYFDMPELQSDEAHRDLHKEASDFHFLSLSFVSTSCRSRHVQIRNLSGSMGQNQTLGFHGNLSVCLI